MPMNYIDRIFWMRAGFGVLGGSLSDILFSTDYVSGILFAIVVFLVTFYLVRSVWGKKFNPDDQRKLITTGLGSYALLFFFFWIFLFTLKVHYLVL